MRLSLRHYRAFLVIARTSSFAQAAEDLHVTPSALSRLIRDLEETWQFRVFDRTTRKVELNANGQLMLPHVAHMMAALREVERVAGDVAEQRSGVVRMATTRVITWTLLTRFFAEFHQRWPGVRLEPIEVGSDDILAAVERQEADIGITMHSAETRNLQNLDSHPIFFSRAHMVCPVNHPLAGQAEVPWSALNDEPLIFIGQASEARYRLSVPSRVRLQAHYIVSNTSTALALAASGAGIALCTGYVKPMTRMHGLPLIPLTDPVIDREFMLYTRKDKPMSPAVAACHHALMEHFAGYGEGPIEGVLR